jgi:hypothetical protein
VVFFLFPAREQERQLLVDYQAQDSREPEHAPVAELPPQTAPA